jgi:uncharacterized coiled-coil DUF342 family protein
VAADATLVPHQRPGVTVAGDLENEVKALRDKAGRIADELAALYRRMDELHRQIDAHRRR